MSNVNLQDSFEEFCRQNKFEINSQQKEIIYLLEKFLITVKSILLFIFIPFIKYEYKKIRDNLPNENL